MHYTLSRAIESANPVQSPTQLVSIYLNGPSELEQAILPDRNEQGWLLMGKVENGANVSVNVYKNMLVGDIVTVYWQAFSSTNAAQGTKIEGSTYEESKTVGAPELAGGVKFVVHYTGNIDVIASASPYAQGACQVQYKVTQSGHEFSSEIAVVPIDLGTP